MFKNIKSRKFILETDFQTDTPFNYELIKIKI